MNVQKKIVLGVGLGLVVVAVVVYEVILPAQYAKNYNKNVHASAASLHQALIEVADSTKRPIFTKDTTPASDKKDIAAIQSKIAKAQTSSASFKTSISGLKHLPLSGYFGSYHQVKVTETKAEAAASTVDSRLNGYKKLVAFMDAADKVSAKVEAKEKVLDEISDDASVDTVANSLGGASQTLRQATKEYTRLEAPGEMESVYKQFIALVGQMADVLETLKVATQNLDVSGLTAGEQKYDKLSDTGDKLSKEILAKTSQNSQLIKPVKDLPDVVRQLGL